MANYGGATKGYAPLSTFKEDIYAELEKPISTQNLDRVMDKLGKVADEINRAKQGINETLNSGGKVSTKTIEALTKEARTATEVFNVLTKKIAEFEQFANAKTNFPKQFNDLYKLRNSVLSVKTDAQRGVEDATGVTKQKEIVRERQKREKEEEAQRAKAEEENLRRITEERQKAREEKRNASQTTPTVIPDASQQKNGEEILPVEQVKQQSDGIVEACNKAEEAIQKVASGSVHTYTRKGEYFSNVSHSGWYENELKKMSDEELKEERERLITDKKSGSYGSDEENQEMTRIDSMLKWTEYEIKARRKLANARKSSGGSKTGKGIVPKEQTEQEFNSLQELNEAIRQTQGELDALHQRTKDTGIINEGDIEEAKTLEKELSRLVATRKLLVGKNLVEKQQPQAEKQPNQWKMFSLPDDGIAEAQASSFEKIKNAVSTLPSVFASAKSATTSFIGTLGSIGSAVQTATAPIVNITKFGLHLFAEGCKKAGAGRKS